MIYDSWYDLRSVLYREIILLRLLMDNKYHSFKLKSPTEEVPVWQKFIVFVLERLRFLGRNLEIFNEGFL